jgi:hypothetical protein
VFVLDDSGSVGSNNFRHALDFVKSIVNQIEVGPTKAQVGLLAYSTHPQVSLVFSRKKSEKYLLLNDFHNSTY